ncbi:unnamed protein product [Nippostrongylus brasiliensis]|uniref:Uncharacterized protein n=1 Tax=Nippostrongylus brasiliensis TaxID=27835 RepID=A0A0N4XTH3_NIPBR|nr:unnamed protein product [Nippostrongylus brasiliensis]
MPRSTALNSTTQQSFDLSSEILQKAISALLCLMLYNKSGILIRAGRIRPPNPVPEKKMESPKATSESKPQNNISKKVTSVVRRLSPFGSSSNLSKEKDEEKQENTEEKKTQKIFKETVRLIIVAIAARPADNACGDVPSAHARGKMDRIKKSFKTNERQQLIDSDDEQ